jgi:hypothetical protein
MKKVVVIPSEKDGAELRKAKAGNKYYVRCDGKADDEQINEALKHSTSSRQWLGLGNAWNRIFGVKNGRNNTNRN